jgi:hypothetical protein
VPAALATVPVGCTGDPHFSRDSPTANPHDPGDTGNPHNVGGHHDLHEFDACPGSN